MYLFKLKDGSIIPPYSGFNADNPDFSRMVNVEEVLVINKVLVPRMRLVIKPLNERTEIRKELSKDSGSTPEAQPDEAPKKTRRRAKKD